MSVTYEFGRYRRVPDLLDLFELSESPGLPASPGLSESLGLPDVARFGVAQTRTLRAVAALGVLGALATVVGARIAADPQGDSQGALVKATPRCHIDEGAILLIEIERVWQANSGEKHVKPSVSVNIGYCRARGHRHIGLVRAAGMRSAQACLLCNLKKCQAGALVGGQG